MSMLIEGFVKELEEESKATRVHLARVPAEKHSFKPHPKSMDMITLASHIADIPGWGAETMKAPEYNMPPDWKQPLYSNPGELVSHYDKNVAAFIEAMRNTPDPEYFVQWSLKVSGKAVMTMPRIVVIRAVILNHLYHHRGQLGVYLRLNDIPLPATYGPSADEEAPAPG